MKKSTKLIAMLTVTALLACVLAAAIADDRLFTSGVFSIPMERVEEDFGQQAEEDAEPKQSGEPEAEPEEEDTEEAPEVLPDGTVERKVLIRSSRGDVVIENQIIRLTSKLIGFDGVEVHYQWQVDRGDGNGWVDVDGATGPEHTFVARKDTILYSWRLTITTDE